MQQTRNSRKQKEREREYCREDEHSEQRHFPVALSGGHKYGPDERRRTGKRGQRERQSHQQRAQISASLAFLRSCYRIQFCEDRRGNRYLVKPEQVKCKKQEQYADK